MARLRRVLIASMACGAMCLHGAASSWAQPAPGKLAAAPDPSPLLVEPKTPAEYFASTLLMVDLARMDLARKYLDQFDSGSPDDELMLKIRDKHGTSEFVKLARIQ